MLRLLHQIREVWGHESKVGDAQTQPSAIRLLVMEQEFSAVPECCQHSNTLRLRAGGSKTPVPQQDTSGSELPPKRKAGFAQHPGLVDSLTLAYRWKS